MDIEMFLDECPCWEAAGLHCPLLLQEMFLQAAHSGRREMEQMICQGCQHGLPQLDPQVDISTTQLVGTQTSKEEIQGLYHQVYKLKRLPGAPPCEPERAGELTRDIMSSLKNHPRQEEDGPPGVATYLMQSQTSPGEREGTLVKVQLAKVRETHQKALATTMGLEEEIEELSHSITHDHQGTHVPSQSWDWRKRRS